MKKVAGNIEKWKGSKEKGQKGEMGDKLKGAGSIGG